MIVLRSFLGLGLIAGLLMGCKHSVPYVEPAQYCGFEMFKVRTDSRVGIAGNSFDWLSELEKKLLTPSGNNRQPSTLISTSTSNVDFPPAEGLLYMSGGNEKGAFGAGILQGFSGAEVDGLPEFRVVTGVSTGAILSLAAFANHAPAAADGYRIAHEAEAINAYVNAGSSGDLNAQAGITAARRGALADLTPLMESTKSIIMKYDLVERIAMRSSLNQALYTGVVDLDTGEAIALDMGKMAENAHNAKLDGDVEKADFYVDCMVKGIAASSSVPLAAKPIDIDNRLYIDGGARFYVFDDAISKLVASQIVDPTRSAQPVYMIANGFVELQAKCGKKNPDDCFMGDQAFLNRQGQRKDWSLIPLIARTVDVLKTQVAEFSVHKIHRNVMAANQNQWLEDVLNRPVNSQGEIIVTETEILDLLQGDVLEDSYAELRMERDELTRREYTHLAAPHQGTQSCADWRAYDAQVDQPLQFHPRYMRCLIQYGCELAIESDWKPGVDKAVCAREAQKAD